MPGTSAGKVIELFELRFGKARMQTIPCDQSIQFEDVSSPLNAKDTYHFRSVIDTCLYLARDRPDLLFVEKELSGLRKLVGYLKMTSDICLVLEKPQRGQGRWKNSDRFWILESFSDSDWSSNQSRRRPTSSGMHMLNGCFLFGSSRTQRVISLSSCEAELHALVSTLCDDFFLRRCLVFLTGAVVDHFLFTDSPSARQLSMRQGAGKIKHLSGKILWIQQWVMEGKNVLVQVPTLWTFLTLARNHVAVRG